ncbi:hypothetical protein EG68_11889 [Paragonimus skrjabini miyazakii]|uniref:Uncharacterized protein n=1 Tax=Paragonimus skrjabini miyazakii TaxID=59628 RepID=A0A8S9YEP3_9TREM|nr:hypothetical protein EG68_11889 [Paragonimus skrjabini miyazakii]
MTLTDIFETIKVSSFPFCLCVVCKNEQRPGTADSTITKLTVQSEADVEKVASNRQFLNVIAEEKENSPCAPSYRSDSSRSDKFGSQSSDTRPSAVDCLDMCQTSSNHEVTDAGVCATKTDEKMSKVSFLHKYILVSNTHTLLIAFHVIILSQQDVNVCSPKS